VHAARRQTVIRGAQSAARRCAKDGGNALRCLMSSAFELPLAIHDTPVAQRY